MKMRNCPRCGNTSVIEDGYCGYCRECTLPPLCRETRFRPNQLDPTTKTPDWIIEAANEATNLFNLGENLRKSIICSVTVAYEKAHPKVERDGPCYYCHLPTSSLAGDPGLWPVVLCHPDEPGVPKIHHERCVSERLHETKVAK